jgi:hypothetical protein
VNLVAEKWDDLVASLRSAGKSVAATALGHSTPAAVTAKGELTVALDESNPIYEQALAGAEVTQVMRDAFPGIVRVVVRAAANTPPPARLTDEMVRAERLTAMRKKDPVLDRAIEALDLDLAD